MAVQDEIWILRRWLAHALNEAGYCNVRIISRKLEREGYDVLQATHGDATVAVRAYRTRGHNLEKTVTEMLRLSSLAHPNVIRPLSLFRTDGMLGIVTEFASAGSLFRLVPAGGLPFAEARRLFQQLALALQFCHMYGIHLRNISPSNLLVSWDAHGMPVVKIFDFRLAKDTSWEGDTVTPLPATLYTCPHSLRHAHQERAQWENYAPVCDVWALAVTLYYLCFGAWPFTLTQVQGWAMQAPAEWNDAAALSAGVNVAAVPQEVRDFMRDVFAGGSLSAAEYAASCPTLESIIAKPWFAEGLPEDAMDKAHACVEATNRLRESPLFRRLESTLMAALQPFEHGEVPPAVLEGMPGPPSSSGGDAAEAVSAASSMSGSESGASSTELGYAP